MNKKLPTAMIKHYIKTSLRNAGRNPVYAFINVAGLAVGLAVCLIIGLFVQSELSYDKFHADSDRIYRIVQEEVEGDGLAWSGPQMGLQLGEDFSQVGTVLRLIDGGSGYGSQALISYEVDETGDIKRFNEDKFLYADPGFFNFFSFPLVRGTPEGVLNRPGKVVITESTARKYFGSKDPVGETLILSNQFPLEVTGVASDPPEHSHLDFDFVASYHTFYANRGIPNEINSFWWPPTHTYVKLNPGISVTALNNQLPAFAERHRDADDASRLTPRLQPLTNIWLGPNYSGQQQAGGSMTYIYLFSAIAVFILILACVNFVNLATARAGKRMKEIGVRKTTGATRKQLIIQFLADSILFSIAALVLAFLIAELLLPFFNVIASKQIGMPYGNGIFWLIVLSMVIITGLAAGAYPAFYLSGSSPALAAKSAVGQSTKGGGLRKGLVIFQFTVSMVLLAGTVVVYQQLQYTNQARMGFEKDQMVILPGSGLSEEGTASRYEVLRSELLQQAEIQQVAAASQRPGQGSGSIYVWEVEGLPDEPNRQFPAQFVGKDFFNLLEVNIIAGRSLRADDPADIGRIRARSDDNIHLEGRAIVINETAARRLGWTPQEALEKQMRLYIKEGDNIYQDYRGSVVGIVEDYHTTSLHEPIQPIAYMPAKSPEGGYLTLGSILVKVAPGNTQQTMQVLEQVWNSVVPERPFNALFLDESLDNLYRKEIRLGRLISAFTVLAVFIACLGLFGLAAYTAETRTKEIGVRKIHGATISQIVILLSTDFIKLVITGFVVAAPIAWIISHKWLQNFAYRIEIGLGIFILSGAVALVIALVTVSWQSIRAALANPVDSLRNE